MAPNKITCMCCNMKHPYCLQLITNPPSASQTSSILFIILCILVLVFLKSLFQRHVLALEKLIFGSIAVRGSLIKTLVVCNIVGSTFVSVHKRNITCIQFILRS